MNREKIYKNYFILSFAIAFVFQMLYINALIVEHHGFRQTQTAITVFWFLKEGISFPYLTPVFGFPWSAPFEFPTYQFFVYTIVNFFALDNLDLAGRIVSLTFYYFSLIVIYKILIKLKIDKASTFLVLIIVVLSPLYIFWSRTFMIESTAIFFTLSFIYYSLELKDRVKISFVFLLIIFAVLASLTKITTFLVGLIFIFFYTVIDYKSIVSRNNIILCIIILLSIACGIYWTHYTDEIKMLNSIASQITSVQLTNWNFGTWEQRINGKNYLDLIEQIFKNGGIGLFIVLIVIFQIKKYSHRNIILLCLITFIVPIMICFNLYKVHSYYLYANLVFLLIAVGLILSDYLNSITNSNKLHLSLIVFLLISIVFYCLTNFKKQKLDSLNKPEIKIAKIIREHLSPKDIIYIKGLDWSSIIPYYAQRKAIMISGWSKMDIENNEFDKFFQKSVSEENPLGALVLCGMDELSIFKRVKYFNFENAKHYEIEQCSLYIKER